MSKVGPVIHICGWPGAGKYTIGSELARKLNGRLLDNHLILDPASALFERRSPMHFAMRADVRAVINRYARDLPKEVSLILTDALAETDEDRALFAPTEALAKARQVPLFAVTLKLSLEENIKRLTNPARAARAKLMQTEVLVQIRQDKELLRPDGAIEIDVTDLSAEEAAERIIVRLDLNRHVCHA